MGKIILAIFGIGALVAIGFVLFLAIETWRENNQLTIGTIDFDRLQDGTFIGSYKGYARGLRLRAKEIQVTVSSGAVVAIHLIENEEPVEITEGQMNDLMQRVIQSQSLEVDVISGASVTSKTYLYAVEDALKQSTKPLNAESVTHY